MQRLHFQLHIWGLLVLVAGAALNVWLFRLGPLAGLLGLSLTKHLVIAWLCQVLGVDHSDRVARPIEEEGAGPFQAVTNRPMSHAVPAPVTRPIG